MIWTHRDRLDKSSYACLGNAYLESQGFSGKHQTRTGLVSYVSFNVSLASSSFPPELTVFLS